jgi:hypothetical protein
MSNAFFASGNISAEYENRITVFGRASYDRTHVGASYGERRQVTHTVPPYNINKQEIAKIKEKATSRVYGQRL